MRTSLLKTPTAAVSINGARFMLRLLPSKSARTVPFFQEVAVKLPAEPREEGLFSSPYHCS